MSRSSRRRRGQLALWRLITVFVLGSAVRLLIAAYVVGTIYLLVTGGFEGWW